MNVVQARSEMKVWNKFCQIPLSHLGNLLHLRCVIDQQHKTASFLQQLIFPQSANLMRLSNKR